MGIVEGLSYSEYLIMSLMVSYYVPNLASNAWSDAAFQECGGTKDSVDHQVCIFP